MTELCDIRDCTGCGACLNVCPRGAIAMAADAEGFLHPRIDAGACISCGLCRKVCPVLAPVRKHRRAESPLALVAHDEVLLGASSSGGLFSLLAGLILDAGGVVFGAAFDGEGRLAHTRAESRDGLAGLRGSKYVQSDTRQTYGEVKRCLQQGIRVFYTGTPCQIAGLYGFLGKTADTDLLLTADVVCHGVPSPLAFRLYLEKLARQEGVEAGDIRNFRFRDLEHWGITPSYEIAGRKEVRNEPAEKNLYMQLFLSARLTRTCCYSCPYASPERVSDLTMADFWGIGRERPFGHDVSHGCSLVLLNTSRGRAAFDPVRQSAYCEERSWNEALAVNAQLHTPAARPADRGGVYAYLGEHTYRQTFNHYFNTPYIRLHRLAERLLVFLHLKAVYGRLIGRKG